MSDPTEATALTRQQIKSHKSPTMKTRHLAIALAAVAATSVNVMATEHLKSVNPAYIDNTVPAADDFYHHVNNGWLKAHPLTPEYARYGIFNILADSAENQVKEIVLNLGQTNPEPGSNAFKIWTLYGLKNGQ